MTSSCAVCGTGFEAKKATARYCSPACRKRAQRTGTARPRTTTTATVLTPGSDELEDESVAAATIEVLREAGRDRTPRGRLAIKAARIIDASTAVMGMAALMKDFDRALEAALAGAQVEADGVDEVEAKRQEKLRRLGVA